MKKAIRFIVLVLALFSLAACSKTTLNTIAVTGDWEQTKIERWVDGVCISTTYPQNWKKEYYYHVQSDGVIVRTIQEPMSIIGTSETGSWLIDGDTFVIRFTSGVETYYFEHTGLLKLVLKKVGHDYVEYITLEKYTPVPPVVE